MISITKPKLPAIDYESHPAYRDLPAASLGDRARSSFALAPSLIRVSGGQRTDRWPALGGRHGAPET